MRNPLSKRLDEFLSFSKIENGISAKTPHGNLRIRAFNPSVFQVTVSSSEEFDDFSYSVSGQRQPVTLSIADGDALVLKSEKIDLTIIKRPLSLVFKNKKGHVLNEDDSGLGISWIGEQITCYKKLQEEERFIGLGEKTGPLNRRGSGYQHWNTDAFAYQSGTDPLYSSIPFYIGIHQHGVYGIFLDNTNKSFFNFGASNNRFSSFSADAGDLNYYFIQGDSIGEIIQHYTSLTGRIPLPPKWSIGYQQCRYSYYPDKEVLATANTFREKNIPADAIVLDIHYMDQYKIFTWDPKNFPDPKGLIDTLKSKGFEVVLICDPGIKTEPGYEVYDSGVRDDVFVKYPDGQYYSGQVWPGWCLFPDFSKSKTREWWAKNLKGYSDLGVEGFWNDMNEPATWGQMLPENIEFDFDGNKATTRKAKNIYGTLMARSTFEASRQLLNGKRPFNLTRSGFSGVQRYAAIWTGDNVSYDEHMMLGIRLVNSLGLSGVAFAGYDVGGFAGEASPRLFARWISIGAFSPFFRGHSMINSKDSEPWSFGEEVENISRNYIRLRYQLMPYLYSLFYEASQTGMPVQRSLAIEYPHDFRVYLDHFQHQYLFGKFILVAPVESNKDFAKVFLPEGDWYSLYDGKKYHGNSEIIVETPIYKIPVFVRVGAILPMQRPVQNTKEAVDELILHVYQGNLATSFEYYEDDGSTYQFESGKFAKRMIHYHPGDKKISIAPQEGDFTSPIKKIKLVLHGFDSPHASTAGKKLELSRIKHSLFLPLEKFDPVREPDSMGEEEVWITELPYSRESIDIHL